jgi:hypothetical protein
MSHSLRRSLAATALAIAAVVVVHAATCRVVHRTAMRTGMTAQGEHFPKATVAASMGAAVLAALAMAALSKRLQPMVSRSAGAIAVTHWLGQRPRDHRGADPPLSVSLCVFRC